MICKHLNKIQRQIHFSLINDSSNRFVLRWLKLSKTEKTRKNRIAKLVSLSSKVKITRSNVCIKVICCVQNSFMRTIAAQLMSVYFCSIISLKLISNVLVRNSYSFKIYHNHNKSCSGLVGDRCFWDFTPSIAHDLSNSETLWCSGSLLGKDTTRSSPKSISCTAGLRITIYISITFH